MERDAFLHVRIPLDLKQRVEESARANRRSVVREIQTMLERCVTTEQKIEPTTEARQC
jgi:hypothetical protein